MKKPSIETTVKAGIILLGVGSFALSYEKLWHVAMLAGIWGPLCWVYGFLTEGFVTIATLTAYVTRGTKAARYAWAVSLLAFGFSLWANSAPETVPPGFVRAVPVVALPMAVHLLIVLLHSRQEATQIQPAAAPAPIVQTITVPAAVTADIDPAVVKDPEAVAFKLLAHVAETPSAKSYYERKLRNHLKGVGAPELVAA
ncbi:DUF2637 domain-containing protein [Actinoplanes sp. NPDC051470]|uniref:DUF2637 domain-containing protein n=1 Tax=Actinoplanes sp. NPDC051470 TaxID=3157224 RepID=UPI00342F6D02